MKIFIKIKPGAGKTEITKIDGEHFTASIKEQPERGKANKVLIKSLAGYFKIPQSRIRIITGHTSKKKLVEIG